MFREMGRRFLLLLCFKPPLAAPDEVEGRRGGVFARGTEVPRRALTEEDEAETSASLGRSRSVDSDRPCTDERAMGPASPRKTLHVCSVAALGLGQAETHIPGEHASLALPAGLCNGRLIFAFGGTGTRVLTAPTPARCIDTRGVTFVSRPPCGGIVMRCCASSTSVLCCSARQALLRGAWRSQGVEVLPGRGRNGVDGWGDGWCGGRGACHAG